MSAKKKTVQQMIKEVDKYMGRIAKDRDDLDAAIEELEGLKDSCYAAYDSLQDARDYLSELV